MEKKLAALCVSLVMATTSIFPIFAAEADATAAVRQMAQSKTNVSGAEEALEESWSSASEKPSPTESTREPDSEAGEEPEAGPEGQEPEQEPEMQNPEIQGPEGPAGSAEPSAEEPAASASAAPETDDAQATATPAAEPEEEPAFAENTPPELGAVPARTNFAAALSNDDRSCTGYGNRPARFLRLCFASRGRRYGRTARVYYLVGI